MSLQAQNANAVGDADFRSTMMELCDAWLGKNIFCCGYDVHQKTSSGGILTEDHYELRLTYDPATQRYICEKHLWTLPRGAGPSPSVTGITGGMERSWPGARPTSAHGDGGWQDGGEASRNVPVGTPLCGGISLQNGAAICPPAELMKEVIGLVFNGTDTRERLMALLKNPEARLDHLMDGPADQCWSPWERKRATFGPELGAPDPTGR